MPTPPKGPRLGGSPSHERLILANLATQLFEHGRITTTETKAKRLRPYAEKLISKAKQGTLHSRREVMKVIRDKDVVHKLFAEIGPSFETRDGGYTRIIKTAPRKGDNAPMAVIELVGEETVSSAASRVTRAAAGRGDRAARVAASTAAAGGAAAAATSAADDAASAVDAAESEDAPDREGASAQTIEAGEESPAEGEPIETDAGGPAETAGHPHPPHLAGTAADVGADDSDIDDSADRDSASAQTIEAGVEAPAEGADEAK